MGSFYKERERLGVDVVEKQKYSAICKEKQTRKSENKYNNINVHSLIFCDITSDKIEFNPNKAANQPFGIVHAPWFLKQKQPKPLLLRTSHVQSPLNDDDSDRSSFAVCINVPQWGDGC